MSRWAWCSNLRGNVQTRHGVRPWGRHRPEVTVGDRRRHLQQSIVAFRAGCTSDPGGVVPVARARARCLA